MNATITTATEIPIGFAFDAGYDEFQPRVTILSNTQLRFEILGGMMVGMVEVVDYTAVTIRPGLFVISWQEKSQTTVIQVADFAAGISRAYVTFPDSAFMRFTGPISHSA
jgi:hypothetical protein